MLGVNGIVGSYTPLVAHISVWETSGISGILVRGSDWERSEGGQKCFFVWLMWLGSDSRGALGWSEMVAL